MGNTNKIFDGLLVLQHQSGNKKALSVLVHKYHRKFCKHSYWYTRDMDVSKDIVQDCWGIIIHRLNGLRDPNSFGSWSMRIVTRRSLDYIRRAKRMNKNREAYSRFAPEHENNENRDSDQTKLLPAIRSLPNDQQVVLHLFYTEDYSLKEIAQILEISVGTVKSRLFHAREKLKTILKNRNDE
ncbi:MAG: RNA polymerase sigma factor [Saonia sp.]